jgi:hypothetical protein
MRSIILESLKYSIITEDCDLILIQTEHKGKCVIAKKPYREGELVFTVPVIKDTIENILKTSLWNMYLVNDKYSKEGYIAFGLCSFLSHSSTCYNVDYVFDDEKNVVIFFTNRNILAGEELTIDYRYNEFETLEFEEEDQVFLDVSA